MYFAVCIFVLVSSTQAGPLPRLRHRPPKWSKLEPIKIIQPKEAFQIRITRKFDSIVHFEKPEEEVRSIFGTNDAIYLTKGRKKHHNNMLDIVEQLVQDEMPDRYQGGRGVMDVAVGLKRGLRRQGGLPPKLEYEFNELVAK